jgi:hypothetical protein
LFPGVDTIFTSKALLRPTFLKKNRVSDAQTFDLLMENLSEKVADNQLDFFKEYIIIWTINKGPSLIGGTVSF